MRRWGLIHKDQEGITLVELLLAIVLVGMISLGITMGISQVLIINARASNHMIAVRQVQQAGDRVSKDVLQAQNVTWSTGDTGFFLTLAWQDLEGGVNEVVYTLEEMPSPHDPNPLRVLERKHTINGDSSTTIVARYLHPDDTKVVPDPDGRKLVFTATAIVGNGPQQAVETRQYEVEPRPTGGQDG